MQQKRNINMWRVDFMSIGPGAHLMMWCTLSYWMPIRWLRVQVGTCPYAHQVIFVNKHGIALLRLSHIYHF
jgi:hypothetical protein